MHVLWPVNSKHDFPVLFMIGAYIYILFWSFIALHLGCKLGLPGSNVRVPLILTNKCNFVNLQVLKDFSFFFLSAAYLNTHIQQRYCVA